MFKIAKKKLKAINVFKSFHKLNIPENYLTLRSGKLKEIYVKIKCQVAYFLQFNSFINSLVCI